MSKFAWVTLATNDSYSLGALVLAYSLKRLSTAHQLAILITPTVSESMRNKLKDVFNVVQEVNVLDSQDAANLALLARPELGITFTKIHCWRLVQFEKCVFLDADTMVLQNCDELFEREELSAAPDVGWPDCFNSGVFVFKPSLDTFAKITQFALEKGSFDGGDQGLLNLYFADWATSDISKHLPFVYNTCSTATYSYLPAFKQFADRIKILHFIGKMKPWLLNFNSQTKTVYAPEGYGHLNVFLQFWWNLFCDNVHPRLTEDMKYSSREIDNYKASHQYTRIERDEIHTEIIFNVTIRDPWEDYYEILERENVSNFVNIAENNNNNNNNNPISNHDIISAIDNVSAPIEKSTERPQFDNNNSNENNFNESVHVPLTIDESPSEHQQQQHANVNNNDSCAISEHRHETQNAAGANVHINSNNNFINTETNNKSETLDEHTPEGGLAGALSKLRLGEERTVEQEAYEQHIRRQCWESGNIDYAGRDSFDNIWRKISETLSTAPKPAETPQEPGTSKLTSADIKDGKVELDRATGIKKTFNKIDKGYTITSEIPQPNGTMKIEVQTFYDPQPLSQAEIEAADKPEGTYKKGNVTTVVKKIPGGKQLTVTTTNKDGTQTVQTQTIYEAEEEEITETTQSESVSPKKTTKIVSQKVPGGTAFQPASGTKKVSHQDSTTTEEVNVKSHRTVEETRRVTETTEISGKSTKTTKKQAIEQQNVQAIEDKSKKTKTKKCPLPADFVEKEGEKTTLEKRKVAGGTEYIFTTIMADGRTQTSRKTVEEETGVDMTEEEIEQYHRQLKEAEKYKNVKKTKKIQTETGTKTVVPSENPGDVTTMETIKIEGGTEYHYTTVHPDGTMKKSSKTVYDPTPVEGSDEEYEEIEEYEEEIIEPGEPIIETIERVVTITAQEKKKMGQVVSASDAPKKKGKKSAAK